MDSKLRKTVVLWVMTLTAALILVVLWLNRDTTKEPPKESKPVTNQPEEESSKQPEGLSAFLSDDTFFDQEKSSFLEQYLEGESLSVKAVSIDRDLRITILDADGRLVAGQEFTVKLDEENVLKDNDKDGVLTVEELTPGVHSIRLMALQGYQVPPADLRVSVKEKPEYLLVEDIDLFICQPESVSVQLEDTGINEAALDQEKTEIKRRLTTDGDTRLGIDVSEKNGAIDWDKVKKAGVDFAILRAGYRGSVTGILVEDASFKENLRGARAAGLEVGISFFSQALTEAEAIEEASAVVKLLGSYQPDYPVYMIAQGAGEQSRAAALDTQTRTDVAAAFCKTIKNCGLTPGIYASRNWYNQCLDAKRLENYSIWLGEHRKAPLYQGYYQMWQYTDEGKLDGIEDTVNFDLFYKM